MTTRRYAVAAMAALLAVMSGGPSIAGAQEKPSMTAPVATVPELFTALGSYVRVAYNNEGYATLGYRVAQNSIGQEWVLLETGITVLKGVKPYTLKREHLTLKTPDGNTIPLATQKEFQHAGGLKALNMRAKVQTDSINYFPTSVTKALPLRFFAQLGGGPSLAFDQLELSSQHVAIGRLFFHLPDGIKVGQYWFNIQFANSEVQVPFRIFTEAENKEFTKHWQEFKKEHEATWK